MGGKHSRKKSSIKDEYLKIIENKKREYYKKNEEVINACDFRNWKDFIIEEIETAKQKFPEAAWPAKLQKLCRNWNTIKDHKWRSNVLWYDYLQAYKVQTPQSQATPQVTLKIPMPSNFVNTFEAQSLIDFLKSHFKSKEDHFIAAMIAKFNIYFTQQYLDPNTNSSTDLKLNAEVLADPEKVTSQLVEEVKAFIMVTLQSMIHYYGGVVARMMEEKPGEMYDWILEEVFSENLHSVLMAAFRLLNQQAEEKYRQQLETFGNLSCADLGLEVPFQLDVERGKGIDQGYQKAIDKLKEIEQCYSPLNKVNVIISTTRLICECVDDYWRDDPDINPKELVIDADQILSIFLYIVLKAKIYNLRGHVKLIYEFGRRIVQHGSMGYYVTTLEACIEQIESLGPDLLDKIKEYFSRN